MTASERNERPNERPKSKNPLSYHTDIYRHFVDCFRTKPPVTEAVNLLRNTLILIQWRIPLSGRSYKNLITLNLPQDQERVLQHLEPQQLQRRPYYVFNRTNLNAFKLARKRNYVYIIRAVVVNTEYNRFTYCVRNSYKMAHLSQPIPNTIVRFLTYLVPILIINGHSILFELFRTDLRLSSDFMFPEFLNSEVL